VVLSLVRLSFLRERLRQLERLLFGLVACRLLVFVPVTPLGRRDHHACEELRESVKQLAFDG
jgi:hypothetical protein